MSLTSLLSDSENLELKNKFKSEFSTIKFNLKTEIKAPPITSNYAIIGTAFDYLLRFYIEANNKNAKLENSIWVADIAYSKLIKKIKESESNKVKTGFLLDKIFDKEYLINVIETKYNRSKLCYIEFIESAVLKDELISSTIFLAKVDMFLRAKIIDSNFDSESKDDINDLHNLISIVNLNDFTANEIWYSNPTFGSGSALVGGADADLIIDNTLIDIKVTKNLKLTREYFNQLIGYYVLSLIGGVNGNPNIKPIEFIGIYFARHGELFKIPVSELGNKEKFLNFKNWFEEWVEQRLNPGLSLYKKLNELNR